MIHLFKVLYYQYFRFYKRFEKFGEEPHPHTRYALTFSLAPLIFVPMSFIATYFCYNTSAWLFVAIPLAILLLMYCLKWKGVDRLIEKERPLLFNSGKISGAFAIIFWIGSFLLLTVGGIKSREYHQQRRYECLNLR